MINGKEIFAAYPQGIVGENDEAAWEWAPNAATGVDDVTFARAVVAEASSLFNIDPSRVFAAGKSNGGGFVNLLACTSNSAAIFAAYAPVSAALYPGTLSFSGCNRGRLIPIINSHGTDDTTVPYEGTGSEELDIMSWRQEWAARNNCTDCSLTPFTLTPFSNATEYTWYFPEVDVIGVSVAGLGHSSPTTLGLDTAGAPENVAALNMTAASIIPFFKDNPLV